MTDEEIGTTLERLQAEVGSSAPPEAALPMREVALMLDSFQSMYTELLLAQPRLDTLDALLHEAAQHLAVMNQRAADEILAGQTVSVFGHPENGPKVALLFGALKEKIVEAAHRKAAQLHAARTMEQLAVNNTPVDTENNSMTDLTRQEVDAKLAANKAEVEARLANFDASIKTGFAEMRADMAKQNGDFRTDMAKLQAEVHKNTADLIKWAIGLAIAIVGMTVGLLTFLNKSGEKPIPQTTSQGPAPLVIAVPPGSTLLNAPQVPPLATTPPPK